MTKQRPPKHPTDRMDWWPGKKEGLDCRLIVLGAALGAFVTLGILALLFPEQVSPLTKELKEVMCMYLCGS